MIASVRFWYHPTKVVDRDFSTAIGGPPIKVYSKRTQNVP
jgi:hypothetical protein